MEPNKRSEWSDEGIIMDTRIKKMKRKKSSTHTSEWREMIYLACTPAREVSGVFYKVVRRSRRRRLASDVALQILGRSRSPG